jgi:hypothetical protein
MRSDSLKKLTSVMTRLENVYKAVEELPAADQVRVLEWAQDELAGPLRSALGTPNQVGSK